MAGLFAGTALERPLRCEVCEQLEADCQCPEPLPVRIAPEKQTATLAVEKRKRGKMVTVVRGLDASGNDLPALLTRLKTVCGAGGCLQDERIEIQGRQVDRVRSELQSIGYQVKG
ncbi:MAG: translation initiation factor [Planctomycetaceae bacterium]